MKASPFSFPQLLLVAFLLIGALLGTVAVRALFSLEALVAQANASATQAIDLSTAAQSLVQRSVDMERSARQSLVLRDAGLRQSFVETTHQALEIIRRLEDNEVPARLTDGWRDHQANIASTLDGDAATALEREAAVAAKFRELEVHNAAIAQEVQTIIARRNATLQVSLNKSRERLTQQVTGSILLAVAMALAFGVWLARPFKRLENAIVGLGQNRLDVPIQVNGPSDVRRVSQQLEWLRLRLTELDADKARFLRHVSHELKTPLASLHEGVAVLGDGVAGSLSASQGEVVRILKHNTQLLQDQIEALLRFNAAAFDAKQLKRERVDMLLLLEDQIEEQRLNWQGRGLRVWAQGSAVWLEVDRQKMASAVGNLLLNAIRFSPRDGEIRLVLSVGPGCLYIDVLDQGPGVALADRERIFEPFYRGQRQPNDVVRGTGIGLSIVQEYVSAHGGSIQLMQSPDHTAHFRIELPYAD